MSARRDLRLLAAAVGLSAAGDLLALLVLALRVHELTGSGPAVSAVFAAASVPVMALAPLAGLIADRLESVRVLVAASLAQAAVAVALALTAGDVGAILALTALLAVGNAVAQPAEFALAPAVAEAPDPARHLAPAAPNGAVRAVGVLEAARYAGFAAGPLLGAALAPLGPRPALLAAAACFAGVALAVGLMRARRRPAGTAARGSAGALAGLRLLRRDAVLRPTLGAAVGAVCFISAALTVEVFYLKDVVGAGDAAYALLVAGWMLGMVAGAMALARLVPAELFAVAALLALGAQGAGMAVQTVWAILPVAFAGYVIGGVAHGAKNTLLRALLLVRVPGPLHGRAFAAYNGARNAAELGALAAGGALVGAMGPRAALLLAGVGPICAAAAGLGVLRSPAGASARRRASAPRSGG